jgi:hypothetical protein
MKTNTPVAMAAKIDIANCKKMNLMASMKPIFGMLLSRWERPVCSVVAQRVRPVAALPPTLAIDLPVDFRYRMSFLLSLTMYGSFEKKQNAPAR